MNFFERLQTETEQQRKDLFATPVIGRALKGNVTVAEYVDFLSQAYHHVKHTVPLLMATGSRLPEEKEWLRVAGHQEWVLSDIAACHIDKEQVRRSKPNMATELMISYAYDTIARVNPLGFFGMVHVLEDTSISLADNAADTIRGALSLPKNAFSYLYSHGSLDQDHVEFFKGLMTRIDDPRDQAQIIHSAKVFYKLYGDVFRSLNS